MKKTVCILFLVFIMSSLCSCGKKWETDFLELPKTTWGMSMEETLDSYGMTKEDVSNYYESSKALSFEIKGHRVFGKKTSKIIFNFIDLEENGNEVLCEIKVMYPENTDMNQILENMKEVYGETISEFSIYDGYQALNDSLLAIKYQDSENTKLWAGSTIAELIPEKESNDYRDGWKDFQSNLNDDNWEMFSQNARTVAAVWAANEDINMLSFYAYNLAVYNHLNSQLSEQQ